MNIPAELDITAVPPAGESCRASFSRARFAAARCRRSLRSASCLRSSCSRRGSARYETAWPAPSPGWLVLATLLEGLSFASYVVMFGPIFCTGLGWRRSWQIGGSELAMGSLVPASGAGGLALGAWVLHRGGMPGERIARRSVAFFLIKSGVNFLAVAVLGDGDGARPRRARPVALADRRSRPPLRRWRSAPWRRSPASAPAAPQARMPRACAAGSALRGGR